MKVTVKRAFLLSIVDQAGLIIRQVFLITMVVGRIVVPRMADLAHAAKRPCLCSS